MQAVTPAALSAAEDAGPDAVRERLVDEARDFFGVTPCGAAAPWPAASGPAGAAGREPGRRSSSRGSLGRRTRSRRCAGVVDRRRPRASCSTGDDAARAGARARWLRARRRDAPAAADATRSDAVRHVLVLAADEPRDFDAEEVEVAGAFAAAAAASLAQLAAGRGAGGADRAAGGARPRGEVAQREPRPEPRARAHLPRGGRHPRRRQRRGLPRQRARTAWWSRPPTGCRPSRSATGWQPGSGLAGKVAELDRPLITNDYQGMPRPGRTPRCSARCAAAPPCRCTGTASCAACWRWATRAPTS